MLSSTRLLSAIALLTALAHAAPTNGGFAAGDIWLNAPAAFGMPSGGLVRIEPLTGLPHMVLPYSSSNAVSEQMGAFCYDPVRDRILLMAAIDGEPWYTFWEVDAAGHHVKANVSIGGIVGMAPAPDGKVYVALALSTFNPVGVLGWLDQAGAYHTLKDATGSFAFDPFGQGVTVFNASLVYDQGSNSLLYAVSHSGLYCKPSGGDGKGAMFRIDLSADGTRALSKSCEFYDMDGPNIFGTGGGIPRGLSRAPGGNYLVTLNGAGATNSLDEAAPRMQLVSPGLAISSFASNGPYTNAAWSTAGLYSSVRHQAVIFDGANNTLRAYDAGEAGGPGDTLAEGLVGGTVVAERAGLLEIQPHFSAQGSLLGTPAQVSVGSGGSQALDIDFGPGLGGKLYLVLGSASGFSTGFTLKGHTIPLNFDAYTHLTLVGPNSVLLANSYGVLDPAGKAQAQFNLPPGAPASIVGLVLHHAALAAQGGSSILGVTNPAPVTLAP
jgi:hypothetical protein